ncbi:uncharacterized protein LOC134166098 isoform X1 [Pezoporus occidentalis]|uniref:uncharacterized protein LOC134166098 isoform X1 n=1 Tax=Pezoporus occidentalis TaxID=407982 RepID=UPI002F909FAE
MQMQVLYMLYLDFRVFQLHFKSIRSSIMWLDQWLSSPIPNHYTGAPSAPSPQQCLQLSISTFGNNKGLSFGSFFALLIRQDPKFLLHRAHGSGLCLRTGRKVKYETGTRSASLPHRTGTRSGSFLHAEAGDSKQELADGCIVSWCPQPYGMRFGIPIKVGIKRSGYAGGTEHAEAGGESLEEEEIIPSDSSCGWPKWSCIRTGACTKRGGALELFGSVLEADGLPLAGDSWLLHPKGVLKGIGLAPKPKELLTY